MTDYYHWRPGFIKKEKTSKNGEVTVVTEPHAKAPYGKMKSFAKFMFFNLDYFFGYWCSIRWKIAKGHLVIFDRYYYDYYLDKLGLPCIAIATGGPGVLLDEFKESTVIGDNYGQELY